MKVKSQFVEICLLLILLCCCLSPAKAQDQTKPQKPNSAIEKTNDDVVKINTNLIQTGVTVFDKKGQFVGNLKQEDFKLRVDNQPTPLTFFEAVTVSSAAESTSSTTINQQSRANGNATEIPNKNDRRIGRTVLFLIDDLHLDTDSLKRTRDLISKFIDREMEADDSAAIVSTNNKLGYLQQFTTDKATLRLAVEKLKFTRDNSGITRFNPPMTEYEALLVDRRDPEMTEIFVNLLAQDNPGADIESLREQARSQARGLLIQAATVSRNTYSTLERAIRASAQRAGRKIVFLISDGFLLDVENTDASYQLRLITDAAARANAVIYSFDAKGLDADLPDNSSKINTGIKIDGEPSSGASTLSMPKKTFTANAFRVKAGERFESQDGLNLLADSTGGRFIHNTNDLQSAMSKALAEASIYYLLAWQPNSENNKVENLRRIAISIKNRPDLRVRVHKGYLEQIGQSVKNTNLPTVNENSKVIELPAKIKPAFSTADEQLNNAVNAQTPQRELPTSLAVNFLDVQDDGAVMVAVLQIKSDAIEFIPKDDEATANIDLLGVILDSTGKRAGSFRKMLTINVSSSQLEDRQDIFYNYQTKLKPGSYQLRVAARDVKSGRIGSEVQLLEIPDLSLHKLVLSSLILSELAEDAKPRQILSDSKSVLGETEISVDRIFDQSSQLRYLVFIYNATQTPNGTSPDLTVQTQILRGGTAVISSPARQVSFAGQDVARLPYAAEIPLSALTRGRYELQVIVQDRTAKVSATQRIGFQIK